MKLDFAATSRNRDPILEQLRHLLPARGQVLEVASGSGQHTAYFAPHFPGLTWQPSDPDPDHRASIEAWSEDIPNVAPPLDLDVERWPWPVQRAEAIFNANMIHIAPWSVCEAFVRGAGAILSDEGLAIIYGPFMVDGAHTAESNAAFDQRLRGRDARWGVRSLEAVVACAHQHRLTLAQTVQMPANNLLVVLSRPCAMPASTA